MHVTYNRRNLLGDGCAEPANGGLSDLGRAAIAEMNRVGVHRRCGPQRLARRAWKRPRRPEQPIVASHTACDAVNHHIRAKPAEVIKAIVDGGGMIGICCIPSFLGGEGRPGGAPGAHRLRRRSGSAWSMSASAPTSPTLPSNAAAENRKIPSRGPQRTRYESFWPEGALGQRLSGRAIARLDELAAVHRGPRPARLSRRRHPPDPGAEHAAGHQTSLGGSRGCGEEVDFW